MHEYISYGLENKWIVWRSVFRGATFIAAIRHAVRLHKSCMQRTQAALSWLLFVWRRGCVNRTHYIDIKTQNEQMRSEASRPESFHIHKKTKCSRFKLPYRYCFFEQINVSHAATKTNTIILYIVKTRNFDFLPGIFKSQ